jgi:N-methylhydantoinase A
MRISVDVGGTFTDVILLDERTGHLHLAKVETTPNEPSRGVFLGFDKVGAVTGSIEYFTHGTTLGINALLTRKGAAVAIVTTKGFRDVYELGRTSREPMYDFRYRKPETLVPRHRVLEVEERLNYEGQVLVGFNRDEAVQVARRLLKLGVESVAVCFLHSYANPQHELAMEDVLRAECPGIAITLSHRLTREYREYERTSTAVIDAYVKPITRTYLDRVDGALRQAGFRGHFFLTRSGGGAMTFRSAREQPVHLVLSGPAGGVIGARHLSRLIGQPNLITIDMGGTSLDAAMVADGEFTVENEQHFETLPIMIPTIDIKTIGAGGGSVAWLDDAGHLQVGPASSGAVPGPACYNKGGREATFTDAALVAGYLDPHNFLGGEIGLEVELAAAALRKLAKPLKLPVLEVASGIMRISEGKIAGAVREISIERGYHPRDFALLAFGGGGGFVAASVARELGIPRAIVPPGPAHFSALGMLMVDVVHDFSRTYVHRLQELDRAVILSIYDELLRQAQATLRDDGFAGNQQAVHRIAEMRYQGQEHTVSIPIREADLQSGNVTAIIEDFNRAHEARYGHQMSDPMEVVTLRVRAVGRLPSPTMPILEAGDGDPKRALKGRREIAGCDSGGRCTYLVYDRHLLRASDGLEGPAIVEEPSSTTVVHRGDRLTVGSYGELAIDIGG